MRLDFTDKLSALVAPALCVVCRASTASHERICPKCKRRLRALPPGAEDANGFAAFNYEGPARKVIAALKFEGAAALAREMAALMVERIPHDRLAGATLVPVPAHPRRRRARGYNQSALLARELASLAGASYLDCLMRTATGRPQSELARAERYRMRADSIAIDERAVRRAGHDPLAEFPTNVVLCDDVRTTGVTLEVCVQAIRARQSEPGSGQIQAAVFASARANGTTDRIARRQLRRPTG